MTISESTKQEIKEVVADTIKEANNIALELAISIIMEESERLSDCTPQFVADIIIQRLEAKRL